MAKTMEDVIPRSIIEKKPSAELRPNQTDEEDLPPYDVLDPLLKQLIEKNASREHLLAQGFAEKTVDEILYRYFRNEYKRRQLPPALKLSESCFGEGKILPINHQYTG
jgi:NH3-dependent NAD+ synthetase